jgi:mitochondrial import inner membrane translocase subunit TIM23
MEDNYLNAGGVSQTLDIIKSAPKTSYGRAPTKDELYLKGYGRQFGEQMVYSVGCAYGAGIALGGTWGVLEGVRRGGENRKLFMNSVANGAATRGPFIGNQMGIMTIFYVASYNILGWVRGEEDPFRAAAAGAISGALFKSFGGWQLAARYSAAGAVVFSGIDFVLKNRMK